jgi:NAD-specific glutamate dehydrogenase
VDRRDTSNVLTSTKIVNNDLRFTAFLIQTVCDGGSGGFIDNTKDLKTYDSASILGGLTLCVVEICKKKCRLNAHMLEQ